ncbi:MAG TPA: DnaJ domain-containing protein [Ktedonobacteraceae bacterium]|nr:DnaJ domain-containing protein [Ktedonobacteraceae bacterium]
MDTPDNYYATLGVPLDADIDTIKRAYRQLARRYHPDLAGPDGAVQMKRINRAYDVLSDPEKRLNYDTIIGGSIDLRKGGLARPRPVARKFGVEDDVEFAGLSIFSTRGPLHTGARLRSELGVISTLNSVETSNGLLIAAGSLDSKGLCWRVDNTGPRRAVSFAMSEQQTIESLRELRFSDGGRFLAGWGRLSLHVWNTADGSLQWSYPLDQRAVSAHYSLDVVPQELDNDTADVWMALPLQLKDPLAPRVHGVRGTDVVVHALNTPQSNLSEPLSCVESEVEKREFWAIRLRALSQDLHTLLTLSCANVPDESEQMIVLRRWDLTGKARFSSKTRPQISVAILAGLCAKCAPPYAIMPDLSLAAFVYADTTIRLHDTLNGTYSELASGSMGASSRLAIARDGEWLAVAREDSEINEGVIDLWSTRQGQIIQKLYHPWQISALHFAGKQLVVALTDGTIQVWH